jgi:hypothetical protein
LLLKIFAMNCESGWLAGAMDWSESKFLSGDRNEVLMSGAQETLRGER